MIPFRRTDREAPIATMPPPEVTRTAAPGADVKRSGGAATEDIAGTVTITSAPAEEPVGATRCRVTSTGSAPGFTSTSAGALRLSAETGMTIHRTAVEVAPPVAAVSPPVPMDLSAATI